MKNPNHIEADRTALCRHGKPGGTFVNILILGVVVLGLAALTAPMVIRCPRKADQTEAVSNARQVGLALFEFREEYGSFPSAATADAVRFNTNTDLKFGTKTSNDFFQQLLGSNIASSEVMFYAKGKGVKKGDNVFTGDKALEKGNCGFSYFAGARKTDNTARPLMVAPMIPGTDRFDAKIFKGKAVVLRNDNSVTSMNINKDGHILIDGRNLMDPGHPIWDGHAPVIAWPDL